MRDYAPKPMVRLFSNLTADAHADLFVEFGGGLRAIQFQTTAKPEWQDYCALLETSYEAATPFINGLFEARFRAAILLVGAKLNAERRRRFPNYALSAPLARANLLNDIRVERTFSLSGNIERTAGIYELAPTVLRDGCWFLTLNSWALIVISQREDFWSEDSLTLMFNAAASDGGWQSLQLNWSGLSKALCPAGDIVIVTIGAFDDKERTINFVYSDKNAVVDQLIANTSRD